MEAAAPDALAREGPEPGKLRTAISFARFLILQRRREQSTTMLQSVLDRVPEVAATDDARIASALLAAARLSSDTHRFSSSPSEQ
jgi:hypothetical protein